MATKFLLFIAFVFIGCKNSDSPSKNGEKSSGSHSIPKPKTLHFSDSGYSSIELRRDTVDGFPEVEHVSRSQSYHFIRFLEYSTGGMGVRHALVNELSIQHTRDAPSEYMNGKITLKATVPNVNPIQDTSNLYRIDWTKTITANEIHYRDEFIEAVLNRDDEKPLKRLLSYTTGESLIQYSSQLYGLQQPNSYDRRFVGYLERPDIPQITEYEDFDTIPDLYPDLFGILTYTNPLSGKSQVLFLKAEQDADPSSIWRYGHLDELLLEGVQAKPKDEGLKEQTTNSDYQQWKYSDFKSLYIVLRFSGAEKIEVRIPVRNDRIVIDHLQSDIFQFRLKK